MKLQALKAGLQIEDWNRFCRGHREDKKAEKHFKEPEKHATSAPKFSFAALKEIVRQTRTAILGV